MSERRRQRGYWRDATFSDDLRRYAREVPRRTAVISRRSGTDPSGAAEVRILDYAELNRLTDRCAGALIELGLRPGDTCAVQLTSRWEAVVLALACIRAGVRYCPLDLERPPAEVTAIVRATGARALVTRERRDGVPAGDLAALAAALPEVRIVVVDAATPPSGTLGFDVFALGTAWEQRHRHRAGGHELGPDDPYLVLFPGGRTTVAARGVLHSQNTLHAAVRGTVEVLGVGQAPRVATTATSLDYAGLVRGVLLPLLLGGTMVVQDAADPPSVLDLLARYGVTLLSTDASTLRALAGARTARPRASTWPRWVICGTSAPPLPDAAEGPAFATRSCALWETPETGPITATVGGPQDGRRGAGGGSGQGVNVGAERGAREDARKDAPAHTAAGRRGRLVAGAELRVAPGAEPRVAPGAGGDVARKGAAGDGASSDGGFLVRGPAVCLGHLGGTDRYATALDADGWYQCPIRRP